MLKVTLLGCGGTMPLPGRALSACAMTVGGSALLFDCGEGTQTAARREHVSLYKTDYICLTHYHGDHIFGLPGYLQSMANLGRTAPVTIFGPKGLREVMGLFLRLCRGLPFELRLVEQSGDAVYELPGLGARLVSFDAEHRVPCRGYRLELPRAGRFDAEKARALGVPQPEWKRLQNGESVQVGGRLVTSEQVMGAPRQGLAAVFCTDTRPCAVLENAVRGADLFICDATYAEDAQQDKAVEFGHSTFAESAALAARGGVARLWLSHYSAALDRPEEYLAAAQRYFVGAEAGFDGKTLLLAFPQR